MQELSKPFNQIKKQLGKCYQTGIYNTHVSTVVKHFNGCLQSLLNKGQVQIECDCILL